MDIKINNISDKFKKGVSMVLVFATLSGCSFNNSSKKNKDADDVYESFSTLEYTTNINDNISKTYDSSKEVINVSLGNVAYFKELDIPSEQVSEYENMNGVDRVKFSVCDSKNCDYIPGIEYVVRDDDNNVIDHFVSGIDDYIIKGLKPDKTYTIEEINALEDYGNALSVYKFTMEDYPNEFKDKKDDYYFCYTVSVTKEKVSDEILDAYKDSNKGNFLVGAYSKDDSDYIDGVDFLVTDLDNNLIDQWTSTKRTHVVSDLADGEYVVRVVEPKEGYQFSYVDGRSSEILGDDTSNSFVVYIKNGEYMDGNEADSLKCGCIFYFDKSKRYVRSLNKR